VKVTDPDSGREITLNGWDFGGQRVYRPTHQLFFSAPAVYLAVWKPREGPQQGFVKEWIRLVKHREPDAKILVVATHGGPKERQPDIDRQEIWDLFGKDMVLDFFFVDSRPVGKSRKRHGIAELKKAIASVAASLPEMGRTVPKRWEDTRKALIETGAAYLPLDEVLKLGRDRQMDEEEARDFVRISHRLGHLIHYEHDPLLQDVVVLKPDWLAIAISFVLDDKQTRDNRGLVTIERLRRLWDDPARPDHRYPAKLHPIFLRLMERFDLSYRIAEPPRGKPNGTSLIAQLVPDVRPAEDEFAAAWPSDPGRGDEQQAQICRIVETKTGQSAPAEGLFFQLIVRLHRYSLGRADYADSVHWQRGLLLQDDYGARALLEHVGNDVRITVRSPYPQRFLSALTYEVKWLVESFWEGLRCDVMVPCLNPKPCIGLFEVEKLIENKRRGRPDQPCPVCNEWQDIEELLHNAPAARPNPLQELLANSVEVMSALGALRLQLGVQHGETLGRFERLDANGKELIGKVEAGYTSLMQALTDEAKEGPRLFSFEPVDAGFFGRPKWISEKFRVTLWCEHSRLPLPALNGKDDKHGVYELTLPREWVTKAAPFLKLIAGTLSLIAPVAASATKLALDEASFKGIEKQLELGQKSLDSVLEGGEKVGAWLGQDDAPDLERGEAIRAQGAVLRELHAWLKEKDPSFGGLVRVQNRRREFLWVHPRFAAEY
jgi:internalin A